MKQKLKNTLRHFIQCIGIFIALTVVALIGDLINEKLLIAPFAASSIIVFVFHDSQFSKLKNVVGGYVISAFIGILTYKFLGTSIWAVALGVSCATFLMMICDVMHPPAGAITIIAVFTEPASKHFLFTVTLGILIISGIAVIYKLSHQKANHWGSIFIRRQNFLSKRGAD